MKTLNENASSVTLVVIVFTSLIFTSVFISYFLMSIYGVQVAGIGLPSGQQVFSSSQDFTTNQINQSSIDVSRYGLWSYNSGIGRILQQKSSNGWSYLLINNIQFNSGDAIINTYHINNSVQQDYTIVLRYTGGSDNSEITISSDGIHTPIYLLNGLIVTSPLVVNYPNMNKVTDVTITTKYYDDLNKVNITFNGITYGIYNLPPNKDALNIFKNYYGGVASDTLGFTVQTFNSQNSISLNPDTDILTQFAAFLVIAFKLVLYNVDSQYLPWELNILLIKPQTIALLVGLLNMRSGS
jgi:hypothetical protein